MKRDPLFVDPPSGWQYGFPLPYDSEKDGDLGQFLVDKGYPAKDVDFALKYCRFYKEKA
jgi:hypothetical protein